MKKLLNIIKILTVLAVIFFVFSQISFAATVKQISPTPTQAISQTQQEIDKKLNNLSESIASKVAELKLVEKKGIISTVTDSSATQITLKDNDGNVHFVDVDELTKFDSSANKNFGISDVSKNMILGVLGLYNKESRRILARFVTVIITPTYVEGAISAIDKTNFTITVAKNDGSQEIVEIEDVTKTSSYENTAGLTKSGFSKTHVGERIYVVGYPDKQDSKQLIASRIIIFPNLPINPAIGTVLPSLPSLTPSPSTSPATSK